jgi:hypothetical protein
MEKGLADLLHELRDIEKTVKPDEARIGKIVKEFTDVANIKDFDQEFKYAPSEKGDSDKLTLFYEDKNVRMEAVFDMKKEKLMVRTYNKRRGGKPKVTEKNLTGYV